MTNEQKISEIKNLLNAEVHLRNQKKGLFRKWKKGLDYGYVSAAPYLRNVSCDENISERIQNIWENKGSEAARQEVLRLALEIIQ